MSEDNQTAREVLARHLELAHVSWRAQHIRSGVTGYFDGGTTKAELAAMEEYAALRVAEAVTHLGNALAFIADIHPDDRSEALDNALAYHNVTKPEAIIEPTGHGRQRLVDIEGPFVTGHRPAQQDGLRGALEKIIKEDQRFEINCTSQDSGYDGPCGKIARKALSAAPTPPASSRVVKVATIAELEAILNSEDSNPVTILPDGTIAGASPPTSWRTMEDAPFAPTHRHLKSGGLYRVVREGVLEADMTNVVIYENAKGQCFVRPKAEFYDGRFAPLPAPPSLTERDGR